jgi:hypothetical protein
MTIILLTLRSSHFFLQRYMNAMRPFMSASTYVLTHMDLLTVHAMKVMILLAMDSAAMVCILLSNTAI